jgi:hypothetical protein
MTMSTRQETANAFIAGRAARCHNATTDGKVYWLHGHAIATRNADNTITFDWCGWFTVTTAAHMNAILRAERSNERVSYAMARDGKSPRTFTI